MKLQLTEKQSKSMVENIFSIYNLLNPHHMSSKNNFNKLLFRQI